MSSVFYVQFLLSSSVIYNVLYLSALCQLCFMCNVFMSSVFYVYSVLCVVCFTSGVFMSSVYIYRLVCLIVLCLICCIPIMVFGLLCFISDVLITSSNAYFFRKVYAKLIQYL